MLRLRTEAATHRVIGLLREVVGMYLKAPTADQEERDLGLARARFHLGQCLLKIAADEDGLAETEAGLELAADVLDRMQVQAAASLIRACYVEGAPTPKPQELPKGLDSSGKATQYSLSSRRVWGR